MKYQRHKEGTTQDWQDCPDPLGAMEPGYNYRVLPEPAAPKWPQTTMTRDDFYNMYRKCPKDFCTSLVEVVNAAIAHECSTGALVPADKVREIEAKAGELGANEGSKRNADRDLEVARAVDKWYCDLLPFKSQNSDSYLLDIVRRLPK